MNVHQCGRCEGSGHVTGRYGWEIPWTRWANDALHPENYDAVLQPRACPDCAGSGILLEIAAERRPDPYAGLPLRIARESDYSAHVARLLARV